MIDLLLGLLAVKKLLRKRHRDGQFFSMEQPGVMAGNFALSFSLNFLRIIFLCISEAVVVKRSREVAVSEVLFFKQRQCSNYVSVTIFAW